MAVKMIKIEFPRGDSFERGFVLKQGGFPVMTDFDEIYFTVKKSFDEKKVLFQKRKTTGGIVDDMDGRYILYIEPADTDGLEFGDYVFDFEFVKDGKKKTFTGKLKLTYESTYASNE